MSGFTFKKTKRETGLAAVAYPYQTTIVKHNKMEVGSIYPPTWQDKERKWIVSLMVEGSADNPNCSWHWEEIKKFDKEPEARLWIREHTEELLAMNLHHMEPYRE